MSAPANALVKEVTTESVAYRMTLVKIDDVTTLDGVTKMATFQPNLPSAEPISVAKGDLLAERFFVTLVGTRYVTVEDKPSRQRCSP